MQNGKVITLNDKLHALLGGNKVVGFADITRGIYSKILVKTPKKDASAAPKRSQSAPPK
jgi:hypothetical protein